MSSFIRISLPNTETQTVAPVTLRPFPAGKVKLAEAQVVTTRNNVYARNAKSVLTFQYEDIKHRVGQNLGYRLVLRSRNLHCGVTDLPSDVVRDLVKLGVLSALPEGLIDGMAWRDAFQEQYNWLAKDANGLYRARVMTADERNAAEARIIHAAAVHASCTIGDSLQLSDLEAFGLSIKYDNCAARDVVIGVKRVQRKAPAKKTPAKKAATA